MRVSQPLYHRIRVALATERFVVIDKPAGLLSVPGKGEANQVCAAAWAREAFGAAGPVVVHRLDMDTSGLLVLARDAAAQRELSAQFERREVEKAYVAVVEGHVPAQGGRAVAPMRLDPERRPRQVVDPVHGRPAVTEWRLLAYEADRSRLELTPITGRTHQLRVHCAEPGAGGLLAPHADPAGRGFPIVGDVLYGGVERDAPRLLLHAARLVFTDPATGRRVEVESAPEF